MSWNKIYNEWFHNIQKNLLAGMVTSLALIPEAIAFSIIMGVDPKIGLYASFCISVLTAIFGGSPGMISAATGSMAIVMVALVKNHGIEYLFAATILTGIFQLLSAILRLDYLAKYISNDVMTGFTNSLAILVFTSQLPELYGANYMTYFMVAAGLGIIYLFPYLTKSVPSPLVAIVFLTVFSIFSKANVKMVGDMGDLPNSLPQFMIPDVNLTFDNLKIILPYSLTLFAVGFMTSLMTSKVVSNLTKKETNKNRELYGQGIANIVTGFFGGMAGCGMVGQSVINIKSGGSTRLSTFFSGAFLLFLTIYLGEYVKQIPIPALVATMIMVSIDTFSWDSLFKIKSNSKISSLTMICTVLVVMLTKNLLKGVLVGIVVGSPFLQKGFFALFKSQSKK